MLKGDEYRFFKDEISPKDRHDKVGLVAMANAGKDLNASQVSIQDENNTVPSSLNYNNFVFSFT